MKSFNNHYAKLTVNLEQTLSIMLSIHNLTLSGWSFLLMNDNSILFQWLVHRQQYNNLSVVQLTEYYVNHLCKVLSEWLEKLSTPYVRNKNVKP